MKLEVHLGVYNTDIIQRHSHIFEYIILFLFLSTTTILSEIICKKRVKYPLCNENRENLPKMCAHNLKKKNVHKEEFYLLNVSFFIQWVHFQN